MNKQLILLLTLCLIQSGSANWPYPTPEPPSTWLITGRRRRRWNQEPISSSIEEEDAVVDDLLNESS
uniref:Uncharacterized protein n=1 Tax=Ciona intestinalis TaxID=7719 RepID=F6RQP0_CIOIN